VLLQTSAEFAFGETMWRVRNFEPPAQSEGHALFHPRRRHC